MGDGFPKLEPVLSELELETNDITNKEVLDWSDYYKPFSYFLNFCLLLPLAFSFILSTIFEYLSILTHFQETALCRFATQDQCFNSLHSTYAQETHFKCYVFPEDCLCWWQVY